MPPLTFDQALRPTHAVVVAELRQTFLTDETRNLNFRRQALRALGDAVASEETAIYQALASDLAKPNFEAYVGEVSQVQAEIRHAVKHVSRWAADKTAATPMALFRAKSLVQYQPRGVSLIIGPWNYPFSLIIAPLVAAIAAGNCAVLKPSEHAPATADLLASLVARALPGRAYTVINGAASVSQSLLAEDFDHIFFTGGTEIGRLIAESAGRRLIPATLELGGKSPCIIDKSLHSDSDLTVACRRIVGGKFFNAGQTCIAPDYLLVDEAIRDRTLSKLGDTLREFYGNHGPQSAGADYARIINERHFDRLVGYLGDGKILHGGRHDRSRLLIEPTLVEPKSLDVQLMREEIFGPILPIVTYSKLAEAVRCIRAGAPPLALYLFTHDSTVEREVLKLSFGGGCINNTLVHIANPDLPFGGVRASGLGRYHGFHGFQEFSHARGLMKSSLWPDLKLRYPPYAGKLKWIRKLI